MGMKYRKGNIAVWCSDDHRLHKKETIKSPLKGNILPQSPCFSVVTDKDSIYHLTIMIEDGRIIAPFNGVVHIIRLSPLLLGMHSHHGIELILSIKRHVGRDKKIGCRMHVEEGDCIRCGQMLMEIDLASLSLKKNSIEAVLSITNAYDFFEVIEIYQDRVDFADNLMTVIL